MLNSLNNEDLNLLWNNSRSHNGWLDKPVSEEQIHKLYDLLKMGATAVNSCPARFVFITSDEAKNSIKHTIAGGNVEKVMTAPVVAVIAYDTQFYNKLAKLFAHEPDAKSWYEGSEKGQETAKMNATLQGAYLMLAARSIGLDYGPIGGFNNAELDEVLFADGKYKSIFICNLGYGDSEKLFEQLPRLDFDEACKIL